MIRPFSYGGLVLDITRRGALNAISALAAMALPSMALGDSQENIHKETDIPYLPDGPADWAVAGSILSRSKLNVPGARVVVLGDSNSHGAGSLNIYQNGWVNLLKRFLNKEFGSTNYGFVPVMSLGNGVNYSKDLHEIAFTTETGGKSRWVFSNGRDGVDSRAGLTFLSKHAGNVISTTIPTFQRKAFVHFIPSLGGGSFDILVNGSKRLSVKGDVKPYGVFHSVEVPLVDGHHDTKALGQPYLTPGICRVECRTTSERKVEIAGFSYIDDESELVVDNYSNSGRRLADVSDHTILEVVSDCNMLVFSLGYNDSGLNLTNSSYYSAFKKKVEYISVVARKYDVPVVVADFVWDEPKSGPTRSVIERLARETGGAYIGFPDMLSPPSGEFVSRYRVDRLKLFFEPAHLNVSGNKFVAETIAKHLGLSVASKNIALDYHDWWMPLKLANTGIDNADKTPGKISAVKSQGPDLLVRVSVKGVPGSTARGVQNSWPVASGIGKVFPTTQPLEPMPDGTPRGVISISDTGQVILSPNGSNDSSEHFVYMRIPKQVS